MCALQETADHQLEHQDARMPQSVPAPEDCPAREATIQDWVQRYVQNDTQRERLLQPGPIEIRPCGYVRTCVPSGIMPRLRHRVSQSVSQSCTPNHEGPVPQTRPDRATNPTRPCHAGVAELGATRDNHA